MIFIYDDDLDEFLEFSNNQYFEFIYYTLHKYYNQFFNSLEFRIELLQYTNKRKREMCPEDYIKKKFKYF